MEVKIHLLKPKVCGPLKVDIMVNWQVSVWEKALIYWGIKISYYSLV